MMKWLGKQVHQSWVVAFLCVGIVVGVVLGVMLRVNYFRSVWWAVGCIAVLVVGYVRPRVGYVVATVMVGMVLAFVRVTSELVKQTEMGQEYTVTAGLETEQWVVEVRDWFAGRIEGLLPKEEAALGRSYLLGTKVGLSKELSENLRAVGLTHIVVASGAHLAILVEVARKIFGKLSRFAGLLFSGIFVVFFMAMVGWTASILRAGLMTILTLVAWYSGRKFESWRLILLVMAVTLMMNPLFVTSLGWQLSFAAYAGIMMLGPRWTKFFYGKRKPGMIGSTIIATLAATAMTLPIILYYFGKISLISVVANLLILPTLPWAMGLTFLTGVVAGIPGVEVVVAWCAARLLDFHIAVVGWFGGMKEFLVEMPLYQEWVWGIYAVILVPIMTMILWRYIKRKRGVV